MKILLIQETDWINKGPLQQNHLMERLNLRSHDIRVIDHEIEWKKRNTGGLFADRRVLQNISRLYSEAKITVYRPAFVKIPNLDYFSILCNRPGEIDRQISEFAPDVILGFQILSALLGMKAAKKNKIPFIYCWTDVYHTQLAFKPYQFIGKAIEKHTLRNSDSVVVINEKLKDYVIGLGANNHNTHVNKGGVELTRFDPYRATNGIKERFHIDEDDIVLGFVGMFHKDLGIKELILELSKNQNKKLKLMLVGESDQTMPGGVEKLREIARDCGVGDRVILTGKRPYDEVPALINTFDFCVLPAFNRNMMLDIVPIKLYEYMAMKKPVISTKLPGVMKEFGENNGIVYVDNPEQIISKAGELMATVEIKELGNKARRFAETCNWDNITTEFEDILKQLILERKK